MSIYGDLLPSDLRSELRVWRNRAKMTTVTIIHSVLPGTGAGVTSIYPNDVPTESKYYHSGAVGLTPAEADDLSMPGGFAPGGAGRIVLDGLDTGANAYNTRRLITGADSIYGAGSDVEVSFEVDGRRYLHTGLTYVPQTDEIVIDLHLKENYDVRN